VGSVGGEIGLDGHLLLNTFSDVGCNGMAGRVQDVEFVDGIGGRMQDVESRGEVEVEVMSLESSSE
jgi:hypothetical protein